MGFRRDKHRRFRCAGCGYASVSWANYHTHRATCKEYKAVVNHERDPYPRTPGDTQLYGCPYCDSAYEVDNLRMLESHVESCRVKANLQVSRDMLLPLEFEKMNDDLDNMVAFEYWCQQNGRL